MKRLYCTAAILLSMAIYANAQKQSGPLPYNKEQLDSLFRTLPRLNQPFVLPVPEKIVSATPKNFEAVNPGAVIINKTSKGTIYNMPADNMAVLVPNLQQVEKMPGSNDFIQAPATGMPNPLYRQRHKK